MPGVFYKVRAGKSEHASPSTARRNTFAKSHLEVRMFNVKDGEAILLVFPKNRAWLVDCGSGNGEKRNEILGTKLAAYLKQRKLKLEVFVPSHPHKDHGGAFTWLLRGKPKLASRLRFYRSSDAWNKTSGWIPTLFKELKKLGSRFQPLVLHNAHREVTVSNGVNAHLFAGSGDRAYTSVFLHLRYHDARLLFTGDAHCAYEQKLLAAFGEEDFRADVLKVTHHGSSSGTAKKVVARVKHGMAIASTAADEGHRLEKDTLKRLGGLGKPRRVFETLVNGDIILRTDGGKLGDGILYQVEFESPGRFAAQADLGAGIVPLSQVNKQRTTSRKPDCQ